MIKRYYWLAAAALLPVIGGGSATAASDSSWFKAEPPVFKQITQSVPDALVPIYSNTDCVPNTTFVIIPTNLLKGQTGASYQTCAVATAYGEQSASDSNLRLHDTAIAGPLTNANGTNLVLHPMPNSPHAMYTSGGSFGSNRYIVKDIANNIDTVIQQSNNIVHQLKPGVTGTPLTDASGALLSLNEIYFSNNARWLVSDTHSRGMYRINTETGESLLFQSGYNHGVGVRPRFISAISADGRFVLTSEHSYGILRLYDLSTCVPNSDLTKPAACQFRDLFSYFSTQISDFKGIWHARFSTNNSLRLYILHSMGSKQSYLTLTAAGEKESLLEYLALGDSFASGEGAFNYRLGTDVREPQNTCHLSNFSYPYLLARRTGRNSAQSVACSGAKMRDVTNYNYTDLLAQSKGKADPSHDETILNNYLPGYRPQVNFVDRNKPDIVTVSISGNDIGFSKIILACLAPDTCYSSPQERLDLVHTINTTYDRLVTTFESIKYGASTQARIYALGYPFLADPDGNCAVNVRLNKAEIQFANQVVSYLNSVIQQAAAKAGVSYINLEHALNGYRLCETVSSRVAVNGVTAGDDKTFSIPLGNDYTLDGYFAGRETFHPNQKGHQLMSDAIEAATNNFSNLNPLPNIGQLKPVISSGTGLTGSNIAGLLPRKIMFEDNLVPAVWQVGKPIQLIANGLLPSKDTTLQLGSDSEARLRSTYRATATGEVSASFILPNTIPPGTYTAHLYGKNKTGEDIDVQKVIYIAATADDFDGDNIPNSEEECLLVEPALVDEDQDTIDDGCDGYIGNKPMPPPANGSPLAGSAGTTTVTPPSNHAVTVGNIDKPSVNASNTNLANPKATPDSGQASVRGATTTSDQPFRRANDKQLRLIDSVFVKPVAIIAAVVSTVAFLYIFYIKWRMRP
ncbi:MAG: SGNH/GDSL hydrolase family protein [Candidatus Saccharimonadales bacterium]